MADTSGETVCGYWDIRGLQHPISMALTLAGVAYRRETYTTADTGAGAWQAVKATLPAPFPNLPYLRTPDGTVLVQSGAILRHVARCHPQAALYGAPGQEAVVDMLSGVVADLKAESVHLVYCAPQDTGRPFAELLDEFRARVLAPALQRWAAYLDGGAAAARPFLVGERPCFADLELYELLAQHEAMSPAAVAAHASLGTYLRRVEAHAPLAAFFGGAEHEAYRGRFNNTMAHWVGPADQGI